MKDILLAPDGDLHIDENGDIALTDGVRQAVRIRLQWFLGEWRFGPLFGLPYFEEILVKNPDIEKIRRLVKDEVESVDEVREARNVQIALDKPGRRAHVTLDIVTAEGTYREEVQIYA